MFLDFGIMASYSFLILRAHVLIRRPGSNLVVIAITYVVIYVLYVVWGKLREKADPVGGLHANPFSYLLLGLTALLALVLLGLYLGLRGDGRLGLSSSWFNAAFLLAELVLIGVYRHMNWSQRIRLNSHKAHKRSLGSRFIEAIEKEKITATAQGTRGQARVKEMTGLHDASSAVNTTLLGRLIERARGL